MAASVGPRYDLVDDGIEIHRGVVGDRELSLLRDECDAHIAEAIAGPQPHVFLTDDVPFRVNDLFVRVRHNDAVLALRAHPEVLAMASQHVGPDAVVYGGVLVFKLPDVGPAVAMHADQWPDTFSSHHRWIALGVYLDDATEGNGCVWAVPGSHRRTPEERAVLMKAGFDPAVGAVALQLRAGDILFHDARVVHGSKPTASRDQRRVVYLSFQNARWILDEGVSPRFRPCRRWVAKNLQLTDQARQLRAAFALPTSEELCVPKEWADAVEEATPLDRFAAIVADPPRGPIAPDK